MSDASHAAQPGAARTSRGGAVFRVPARGPASQIAHGFEEVRGLAYDPARGRLFLVEQRAAAPRHVRHVLAVPR